MTVIDDNKSTFVCSNLDVAILRRLDDAEDEVGVIGVVVGGSDVGRRQHDRTPLVDLRLPPYLPHRHWPLVVHQRHSDGDRRRRRPIAVRHAQAERVFPQIGSVVHVPRKAAMNNPCNVSNMFLNIYTKSTQTATESTTATLTFQLEHSYTRSSATQNSISTSVIQHRLP